MCQIPQMNANNEMSRGELKELINDIVDLSPESIVFSGGEPLLRDDIFELISVVKKNKINSCLVSNGTLIDNEIAKQLAALGIGVVNISIEGPEDIHDSLRGKGVFRKTVEALEHLSRHNIETTIATVVCRQNYRYLPYIMKLADQYKATTVKFQPFSDIFIMRKDEKNKFFISTDALKDAKQSIEQVIKLSRKYKITTNPVNYLTSIPNYISGLKSPFSYYKDCSAVWKSCPISAEGNIYLCWVLSDMILGNAKKTKLSQIWNSSGHNLMRRLVLEKGCSGCLMSCYDYNFGGFEFDHAFSSKLKELKTPTFYKNLYCGIYRYLKYISREIAIQITKPRILFRRREWNIRNNALKEIRIAKDILKSRF